MPRANFHTHSTFCDGSSTPRQMVERALELGFSALGFSGHMDPDISMDWMAYTTEISRLQSEFAGRLDILRGVELDSVFDPATCADAEYVIGSTHYIPVDGGLVSVDDTPERLIQGCREHFGGDYLALSRAFYEFEAQVVDRTYCTFVGHFDLVTRFNDLLGFLDEDDAAYYMPALECMEHLVGLDIPLEINTGAFAKGRKQELYPNRRLLRALHDFGGRIFISSDAHESALLDGGFDVAVERAIEAGFTHTCMLRHDSSGEVEVFEVALDTM